MPTCIWFLYDSLQGNTIKVVMLGVWEGTVLSGETHSWQSAFMEDNTIYLQWLYTIKMLILEYKTLSLLTQAESSYIYFKLNNLNHM